MNYDELDQEIKSGGQEYEAIPDDVYTVKITDIKKIEGKKYILEAI